MSTTTEKICEVVRIVEVMPHPNADRLALAHFELATGLTAYTCVIAKDQFKDGDYAVYVGVDSLVPLTGEGSERWQFLQKRLDAAGKDRYRVRAARLRGVFSEGILMEMEEPCLCLGQEMWAEWNIIPWEPPVRGEPTTPSTTKRRDPTLGGLFPVYGVESLKKVPFLFQPGEQVIIAEKVHGTNLRCGYLPIGLFGTQRFVVGSHRTIKSDTRNIFEKVWHYFKGTVRHHKKHFYGEDVWSRAAKKYDLQAKMRQFPDHVAYFELYGVTPEGKRLQDLTYGNAELGLVLLDVYDADTGTWLNHAERRAFSHAIGVPVFPALAFNDVVDGQEVLTWDTLDAHRYLAEGTSSIQGAEGQIREGFVVHALYDSRRAKLKGQGFLLRQADEMNEEGE